MGVCGTESGNTLIISQLKFYIPQTMVAWQFLGGSWDSVAARRHPCPCGGLIHEHRMDATVAKATMSFASEGVRTSELDAPLLRQTPRSATVASIPFVIPLGFEPKTHSLEGCCSIQLSYGTVLPWKGSAKLGKKSEYPTGRSRQSSRGRARS